MKRQLPLYLERSIGLVTMERTKRALDFEAQTRNNARVTCSKGCTACCHYPLDISLYEGVSLYRALVAKGRWTPAFRARVEEHAKSVTLLSSQVWLLSRIACPLLEKGACLAYEQRPFACRTFISTGDPYFCDPHRLGRGTRIVPRHEVASQFEAFEEQQSKQMGVPFYRLPISQALLFADRLCSGEVDTDNIVSAFFSGLRNDP